MDKLTPYSYSPQKRSKIDEIVEDNSKIKNLFRPLSVEKPLRQVKIVPYSVNWPDQFLQEKYQIEKILGDVALDIEHIGSTAIPNMSAKPVIDILISVKDINSIDMFNQDFINLEYQVKGEFGIPRRRFFSKDTDGIRTHHIHIFEEGNQELVKHINFRDYMRTHLIQANEYTDLKIMLAMKFPNDISGYCAGKENFIKAIDIEASKWKNELK